MTWLGHAQDVEIIVKPIPRVVSNWLIGIGKLLATLIKLKVTAVILMQLMSESFAPCTLVKHKLECSSA